jgi:hypothetical protein
MAMKAATREARAIRVLVWIPFVVVLVIDAVYVLLMIGRPDHPPDVFTVPFVAVYLALMAAMLGVSLRERPQIVSARPAMRAGAAAGLLVLGVLAIFSIGLPLVVSGALATGAAIRSLPRRKNIAVIVEIAAALTALVVLVAGFEATSRVILCPSQGTESGSGHGLVTGDFSWQCTNGRLKLR